MIKEILSFFGLYLEDDRKKETHNTADTLKSTDIKSTIPVTIINEQPKSAATSTSTVVKKPRKPRVKKS